MDIIGQDERLRGMGPADRVVSHEEGGEGFLLQLDTGRYYSLNRTGMAVWRALETGSDPVEALRRRYPDAAADDVVKDVRTVLTSLESARLVAPREDAASGSPSPLA